MFLQKTRRYARASSTLVLGAAHAGLSQVLFSLKIPEMIGGFFIFSDTPQPLSFPSNHSRSDSISPELKHDSSSVNSTIRRRKSCKILLAAKKFN
jgi:hypothetical protein